MRIAIEGCMHGELTKVYDTIKEIETRENYKVDLLLCCGDFQSVRNLSDLKSMAVPDKYKEIGTFYQYYSGEKLAPVLTIFVGGNHEASNYLQELPFGGWVAPNIYYLGFAGVIEVNGILIGGLSGIYKGLDYLKGRHEVPPYDQSTIRSVYHIRNLDIFRLKQLGRTPDVFLSHDWPRGIHNYGDVDELLRRKRHFQEDISKNELGSRPAMELLQTLKPSYWFSAHLHVKFPAIFDHEDGSCTKFLALDKCLPNRQFLQVISLGADCNGVTPSIKFCPDWLAILKSTNHLLSTERKDNHMPGPRYEGRFNFVPTSEELEEISQIFGADFDLPKEFKTNVEAYNPSENSNHAFRNAPDPMPVSNSQTTWLCQKLDVNDPLHLIIGADFKPNTRMTISDFCTSASDVTLNSENNTEVSFNKDEIQLEDDEEDCVVNPTPDIKQRPLLSLPSPKKTNDAENGDSSPIEKIDFEKEDNKDFTIDTEGEVKDSGVANVPGKRTLKRRNQSMYNQEED